MRASRLADIDAIAATAGPGLIGGLIVGLMTAKAIAAAAGKPLLAINHLEGHALTARLTDGLAFPYLLLLVSGGHTQIVLVRGVGDYERWATTIDDALGEAFDKTAKLIGLPYPGGPNVEKAAAVGQCRAALPSRGRCKGDGAARLLLLRPEDGGAPGGDRDRAAHRRGRRRHLRLVPGGHCRRRLTTASAAASRASAREFPDIARPAAGGRRRRRRQPPRSGARCEALCARHGFAFVAPPLRALHRQCRDDRLGRRSSACAAALADADAMRFRAALALAARRAVRRRWSASGRARGAKA